MRFLPLCLVALMGLACTEAPAPLPDASNRSAPAPSAAAPATSAITSSASITTTASAAPSVSAKPAPPPTPEEREAGARYAKTNNAFAFDLYREVRKTPGNLAMSPTSLSIALAMTWAGAKGQTSSEMKNVLHFDRTPAETMEDASLLIKLVENPGRPLKLTIANRLFGEQSYTFEKAYLDSTEKAFGASLERVDFQSGADKARATINDWVEQKTEKRIVNLVPSGGVDSTTRLVLVNAVYFLAGWQKPFNKASTKPGDFMVSPTKKLQVPMMEQTTGFKYARVANTELIELPYKGGEMSLLIAMPGAADGIDGLEQSLSPEKLAGWVKAMKPERIWLSLPSFEVNPSTSMSLGNMLQSLGMKAAFSNEQADFTGMANPPDRSKRLKISQVFHKAFVKVDEKGTEAAAASAVAMSEITKSIDDPPPPKRVKVDRPFVYFIRDNGTGLVLFLGRVADPTVK